MAWMVAAGHDGDAGVGKEAGFAGSLPRAAGPVGMKQMPPSSSPSIGGRPRRPSDRVQILGHALQLGEIRAAGRSQCRVQQKHVQRYT